MATDGRTAFFLPPAPPPSRRVQTTYRSLSTRPGARKGEMRRYSRPALTWNDPRCRVSPKAPLKIVASSKPHERFHDRTNDARILPSVCSLNRMATQPESSIDEEEARIFPFRRKCSVRDFRSIENDVAIQSGEIREIRYFDFLSNEAYK